MKQEYMDLSVIAEGIEAGKSQDKEGVFLQEKKLVLRLIDTFTDPFMAYSAEGVDNHEGKGKWTGSRDIIVLGNHPTMNNALINILTADERNFFAKVFGIDPQQLNERSPGNAFTTGWKVPIDCTAAFKKNGQEFDLSNPYENIQARILAASKLVWNTTDFGMKDSSRTGTHRYKLEDAAVIVKDRTLAQTIKRECNRFLFANEKNAEALYNFLYIFSLENPRLLKVPSKGASADQYSLQLSSLIDDHQDKVHELIKNAYYNEYVMVIEAADAELINYDWKTGEFATVEGMPLGKGLLEVAKFYSDKKNQEKKLKLKALLEEKKSK